MTVRTKVIGRQPTDHGTYVPGQSYGKKYQVELYYCVWESKHDQNNTAPATLNTSTGVITPNTTDWKKVSGSYDQWLIDNGYKKVSTSNVKDSNLNDTQDHINTTIVGEIGSDSTPNTVKGRIKNLETNVGTGGSADQRIAAAKNEVIGGATSNGNTLKKVEDRVAPLETAVGTGGSIDSRISSAVSAEATRAQAAEADRYTKSETYTKEEVNNLITTPSQGYVSVIATDQTTSVTDVLPATGAADTTYRVGNWDGTQYNDSVFSEYAWNGSAYIKLSTKSQIGEVYDISANHAGTKYADLSAALGVDGVNIPSSLRRGGMSVKFVQSPDNNYIQARCMANEFTTDVTKWQGVDDEPTAGSDNLVKSGGIQTYVNENFARQKSSESDTDLDLTDDLDSILVRFKDGHIKTKNFNSKDVYRKEDVYTKNEVSSLVGELESEISKCSYSKNGEADLDIADENGNIIGRYKDGVHLTKYPSPYTKDNNEVFDVEDAAGNKVFRIKNGYPVTKNFDGSKVYPMVFKQVRSSIGEGQMRVSYPSIASDANIELTDFPRYIDTRKFFSFIGYMDSFPANAHFDFGVRYKYNNQYWHSGGWIRVTSTSVEIYHDSNENVSTLEQSYTHGLTLTTFVKVFMYLREDYSLYIILETVDGKYVIEHNRDNVEDKEIVGHPILINGGIAFTNAQITAGSADFKSPIWIFGDSYSTASYGYSRIGGQLMDLGLTQNTCYDHLGGNNHQNAWDDLQLMLQFGTPRMIVWLLGVNGSQPNNVAITGMLKDFCDNNGIELILEYPPLYPNSVNIDTTALRNAVLATECRIVDFSRAVGCHIENNDVVWYDGYLQGDRIHPTEKGSRALVMQIINDIPELLQWGVNEHPVYYSSNNN